MLAVTETALPGAGLSIPCVVEREAQPCLVIRTSGAMPDLPKFAPPKFGELRDWMRTRGIAPKPGFFRYRRFGAGGHVELDVGNLVTAAETGAGNVEADNLPAGRYALATYIGPYDRLYDAFSMLQGWMAMRGLKPARNGDEIGGQIEIYRVSPMDVDDPAKFETDILILLG